MSKKAAKRKPSTRAAASTMPSAGEQLQAARREMRQLRELKVPENTKKPMARMNLGTSSRSDAGAAAAAARELTTHPIVEDDNMLQQLLSAVERIEAGLGEIYVLVVHIDERAKGKVNGQH